MDVPKVVREARLAREERKRERDRGTDHDGTSPKRRRTSDSESGDCADLDRDDYLLVLQNELLEDDTFSDLVVVCKNQRWKVHRAIVAQRCGSFKACCTRGFKESESRQIDMSDDDPKALSGLLYYLYTLEYPWQNHSEVLRALDRLDAAAMSAEAASAERSRLLKALWTLDIRLWQLADKYDLPGLMAMARDEIILTRRIAVVSHEVSGFVAFVDALYSLGSTDTTENLRKKALRQFRRQSSLFVDPLLQDLLADRPEFAVDFIQVLGEELQKTKRRN